MAISDEALNKLFFWKDLPRLRFASYTWPSPSGLSIQVATDAGDFGWGGHTLSGVIFIAHEYFSEWESIQSSIYRDCGVSLDAFNPLLSNAKPNSLCFK